MKNLLLFTLCLLLTASMAFAQLKPSGLANGKLVHRDGSTTCGGGDPILPTDGLPTSDTVSASSANYYFVHLKDGHSYSAEVWDATDPVNFVAAQLSLLDSSCTNTLPTTDVVSMDPDMSLMFADRIAWFQAGDALDVLKMNNSASQTAHYTIRIVDTTLHNSRWSTVVGFSTHYGFLNTTEIDIPGTLTLTESSGAQHVATFTVPAGGETFEVVSSGGDASPGLQLPPNLAGSASFAFVGAAGAIKADGYFQAVQNGVFVIVPTEWAPRNSQH
jgi:hypothetical protein